MGESLLRPVDRPEWRDVLRRAIVLVEEMVQETPHASHMAETEALVPFLREELAKLDAQALNRGCFCPVGQCQSPIMVQGRQVCRDPEKAAGRVPE